MRPNLRQTSLPRFSVEWEDLGGWKIEPAPMATRLYNALSLFIEERGAEVGVASLADFKQWEFDRLNTRLPFVGPIGAVLIWNCLHPDETRSVMESHEKNGRRVIMVRPDTETGLLERIKQLEEVNAELVAKIKRMAQRLDEQEEELGTADAEKTEK